MGRPRSEETKQRIRDGLAKRKVSGLPVGQGQRGKGKPQTAEHRAKRLSASVASIRARAAVGQWAQWRIGQKHSSEALFKMSERAKTRDFKKLAAAMSKHPNKLECAVLAFLIDTFPEAGWQFNPGFVIARKIPDFVRKDGVPIVVDVHGDYWHRHDTPQTIKARQQLFKSMGYQLVVIWEYEFHSTPSLLATKIKRAEHICSRARR